MSKNFLYRKKKWPFLKVVNGTKRLYGRIDYTICEAILVAKRMTNDNATRVASVRFFGTCFK